VPVVSREAPRVAIGILSRSDLLAAHRRRLDEACVPEQGLRFGRSDGARAGRGPPPKHDGPPP
jgi:CIC family chloride channel protein